MLKLAWLIPVFPLLAFAVNIFFGKRLKGLSAYLGITAIAASFLISLGIFFSLLHGHAATEVNLNWLSLGGYNFGMGVLVDGLTAVMLIVVTLVSLLVQIYSIGYMRGDPRYPRYYAFLGLFTFSMLFLVVANNFAQIYISWELVGVSSYLLIGFWYEKKSASDAGKKAFITNKIGDFGFSIGIMMIFAYCGTLNFNEVSVCIRNGAMAGPVLTTAAILVFCGAIGKSAQFPLHVWLPDAMEGPTPVSALIHAATMVAAGVYLIARTYFLYDASPTAAAVVVYVGVFTAFFAATMALVANDIKRVLAFSTVSQLGFMVMALGAGGFTAGMFHLTTHAFFKALLFLGAGSVIHGAATQDIREMGGLSGKMKITMVTFFIACLAISGIPPFAGFYSKDEIMVAVFNYSKPVFFIAIFTAFMTAFYMFRLFFMTFTGEMRTKLHPHESPLVMTVPLMILAVLSITAGWLFMQHHAFASLVHYREVLGEEGNRAVMFTSVFAAFFGIALSSVIYYFKLFPSLKERFPSIHKLLINKYYVDEFYDAAFIRPILKFSNTVFKFDVKVIDGAVNNTGIINIILSKLQNIFDKAAVDGAVNGAGNLTRKGGEFLKRIQTGFVQNYLLVIVSGLVIAVIVVMVF
ncbi:MAG: NADH-quinone oxidoreductase subunit L [Candidatus Firestonebacteria bacterium]